MTTKPSPFDLWRQAEGAGARYRDLLAEHGMLLNPGDEGFEQASRNLPCGWPGKSSTEATADDLVHSHCGTPVSRSQDGERFWCVFCLEYVPEYDLIREMPS